MTLQMLAVLSAQTYRPRPLLDVILLTKLSGIGKRCECQQAVPQNQPLRVWDRCVTGRSTSAVHHSQCSLPQKPECVTQEHLVMTTFDKMSITCFYMLRVPEMES